MSVNPGFGGQSFKPQSLKKIADLRRIIDDNNYRARIEVDGGVTLDNAEEIINSGAHVLVAGNTVFKSTDPKLTISKLKAIT